MTIRLPALIVSGLIVALPYAASAQTWRATTHACDVTAETTFCVGKAGCPNWEWLADCTARNAFPGNPQIESRLQWCKNTIARNRTLRRTPAMVGDPVAETMNCLLGAR